MYHSTQDNFMYHSTQDNYMYDPTQDNYISRQINEKYDNRWDNVMSDSCKENLISRHINEKYDNRWDNVMSDSCKKNLRYAILTLSEFVQKYTLFPEPRKVLDGFRAILPSNVKVVFVGQSPYPGVCPKTGTPYACGPAFLPNDTCITTPLTLRVMMDELCRDLNVRFLPAPPRVLLKNWMRQGVMLLNASLTIGSTDCPPSLLDHSLLWEAFMREAIHHIATVCMPVFLLIGKEAWKFETCTGSRPTIKVSHPAARNAYKSSQQPWIGSGVFSKITNILQNEGKPNINWLYTS